MRPYKKCKRSVAIMELSFKNITKKYKSKQALTDINITLHEGVYALLGPNGAGKSTLMNILVGLIPATTGEVLLDGKNTVSLGADFRGLLGFLPQEPGFYPSFSGYDIMKYYADLKGVPDAQQRVNELLELVNLASDKKRRVGQYSGGMKRRLGIAVALLNAPKILVMDEPSAGLDPEERIRLRNIISNIGFDRIVILATHIVSDVESIADECLLLKDGKLIASGTPDALKGKIAGKVWDVPCGQGDVRRYMADTPCTNIIKSDSGTCLHIVSDERPADSAVSAAPGLEDVYVYYFNERSR